MKDPKKRCLIPIDFESLKLLLNLPNGVEVVRVFENPGISSETAFVEVTGIGSIVYPGCIIPKTCVTFSEKSVRSVMVKFIDFD